MSRIKDFITIYEYFQSRIRNREDYHTTESEQSKIYKFVNDNDIKDPWDYLSFLFSFKCMTMKDRKVIPFNNIIGKKALERYQNRNQNSVFRTTRFLLLRGYENPLNQKKSIIVSEEYWDKIRQRNINKPEGYIECVSKYECILYNEKKCKDCRYNKFCKNVLQKEDKRRDTSLR